MPTLGHRLFLAAGFLLLAGCAASSGHSTPLTPSCAVGDSVMVRETLYFGRNRPDGGTVSDNDWNTFLADVVTPRFPQGLTVVHGTGQWKGADGSVIQEQSEIVTLFHPDNEAATRSVQEISQEFKRRFQQEAVLREREPSCTRLE